MSLIILIGVSCIAKAQYYLPDSSFNNTGIKIYNYYNRIDRGFGSVIQPDQKLIMVGLSNPTSGAPFELIFSRFKIDGTLDSTFSGDGKVNVAMGNQSSIGGQTPMIKLDADGNIVCVNSGRTSTGNSQDMMVCRLDSTGVLDLSFNGTGVRFIDMTGSDLYPDVGNDLDIDSYGNIYIIGSTRNGGSPLNNDFAVVKITPTGLLDNTFDTDGKKLFNPTGGLELGTSIKIQADGKIVFGGSAGNGGYLMRIDSTGVLDPTFNGTGGIPITFGGGIDLVDIDIDSLGRIVCTGPIYNATADLAVMRYIVNGTPDLTFGNSGRATATIGTLDDVPVAIKVVADNKILLGGQSDNSSTGFNLMVCRFDSTGVLDASFNATGFKIVTPTSGSPDDELGSMAVMNDGRIMLIGTVVISSAVNEDVCLVRLRPVTSLTGIETIDTEQALLVYPNPSTDYLNIQIDHTSTIIISDITGRTIVTAELTIGNNSIDIHSFTNGIYFIKNISTGTTQKFVKR